MVGKCGHEGVTTSVLHALLCNVGILEPKVHCCVVRYSLGVTAEHQGNRLGSFSQPQSGSGDERTSAQDLHGLFQEIDKVSFFAHVYATRQNKSITVAFFFILKRPKVTF